MPTIDVTVGGASSNSYATLAEANTYFDERLPLSTPWVGSGESYNRALIMAARTLNALVEAHRTLRYRDGMSVYYTNRTWTGTPASSTQRLAWPRVGMYDRNGVAIAEAVVPQDLKEAQAELAGQLLIADTTLDNEVAIGGITSVKAGSVAVTFKENIDAHVLPSAVLNLMPASWLTDELIEPAMPAEFDVL